MAILLHGTTRQRAERIVARGPDPRFIEPGGGPKAENFSTYLEEGPYLFRTPQEYAWRKARGFPNEGGPVILRMVVPEEIIALAVTEYLPQSQGLIQFDVGGGLEGLLSAWPQITKEIVPVEFP